MLLLQPRIELQVALLARRIKYAASLEHGIDILVSCGFERVNCGTDQHVGEVVPGRFTGPGIVVRTGTANLHGFSGFNDDIGGVDKYLPFLIGLRIFYASQNVRGRRDDGNHQVHDAHSRHWLFGVGGGIFSGYEQEECCNAGEY